MSNQPSDAAPPNAASGHDADGAAFERIDWESLERSDRETPLERIVLVAGLGALTLVYLHHRLTDQVYLVHRWNVGPADWLVLLSTVVLVAYGAVPLARNPRSVRRILRRLAGRRLTALALSYLSVVLALALYAVVSDFQPRLGWATGSGLDQFQPPVGFSGPYLLAQSDCVGPTTDANTFERECMGTWMYPLGTDRWGYELTDLLLVGTRPLLYATVVTLGVIVPLAAAVGLLAGYYGGLVDDVLMAYVDVQLSLPAIVLYMIAYLFFGNSMFLLLVAFGLLSWGGIARIVRSETLQRREEGYVLAARAVGAPDPYVLRHHVLPNVTNSIVPAACHLMAVLVLTEAGLSFLGFHVSFQSWGMTIAEGVFRGSVTATWWNAAFPAVALGLTVGAIKVAGDGLRDVLDPRGEP